MKNTVFYIAVILMFISLHTGVNNRLPETLVLFYSGALALFALTAVRIKAYGHTNRAAFFLISVLVLSFFLRYGWQGNPYGTYRLYVLAVLWALFFPFSAALSGNKRNVRLFVRVVLCTVALEAGWGIAQSVGITANSDPMFPVGGSLGNPGAYAGYLAAVAPLVLSLLLTCRRSKKAENTCYVLAALFIFILYLLVITRSRGAWIAGGAGCLCVYAYRYGLPYCRRNFFRKKAVKITAVIFLAGVVTMAGFGMYKMKEDSALGRVLVWKTALSVPHENLFVGNGPDYFESCYGKWQAAYFESNGGTGRERQIAGYVTTAYNEFLETGLEQGILVVLLVVAVLALATVKGWKNLSTVGLGAKASVVSVCVLAGCSYPLKVLPTALYLVFCLAVVFHENRKFPVAGLPVTGVAAAAVWLSAGVLLTGGLSNAYGYYLLKQGQRQVMAGNPKAAIAFYKRAEKRLAGNGVFHFYFGSAYFLAGENTQALRELDLSCRLCANPNSFILSGNVSLAAGKPDEAVKAYRVAAYMQPSRLYPKYLLAKAFTAIGDARNAAFWASGVLATPEKVPTTAAREMKDEMRALLAELPPGDTDFLLLTNPEKARR